jgi:DNA-binding NtrC family response regulator
VKIVDDKTKILVVDDEQVVRLSYLRSLAGSHCKVEEAWDGGETLQAMEQHRFDVVLLDLRMPGIDGMSLLRTIKERWPESEAVVITGYPSIESAKEALRLGAHDYLAKPVGADDVINAANEAVMHKKSGLHTAALRNTASQAPTLNLSVCGRILSRVTCHRQRQANASSTRRCASAGWTKNETRRGKPLYLIWVSM